mmetsp:Transcript_21718/g.49424  ORF Transcript_21718/g.49424 Transcript_21718/m.49424 type:complete len:292 (+) Transcript_21718:28-903(+)
MFCSKFALKPQRKHSFPMGPNHRGVVVFSTLCLWPFLTRAAEPHLDATSTGDSVEDGLPGLNARATVLVGTQLETNRAVLENHNMQLQEQKNLLERQIKMVEAQLEEDKKVYGALQDQLHELQVGRGNVVSSMQSSMIKASKSGSEAAEKGFKSMSLLQEQTAQDGNDDDVWEPLTESSKRMEKQYELLMVQHEKVKAAKEHTKLTIAKLESDLKLHNVLKEAIDSQVDVLEKGRHKNLQNMWDAMTRTAAAAKSLEQTSDNSVQVEVTGSDTNSSEDESAKAVTSTTEAA